ncbi:MAG: transglycosylase SLT domain-containing protein [Sulfitobacter sp.]
MSIVPAVKKSVISAALVLISASHAALAQSAAQETRPVAASTQANTVSVSYAETAEVPQASSDIPRFETDLRPPARPGNVPRTRWQHMQGHVLWTRAALSALKDHGQPLVELVPADIENWCPKYPTATDAERRAFWVGFMSALAKHESTYKPWAVGGGGLWYGLLQILPSTARGYKCNVGTGAALKNGAANLSCAVRIMATTVPRDGVIHGYKGRKGQGVTADWGPMHSAPKRRDMSGWLKRQTYCKPLDATRPKTRP